MSRASAAASQWNVPVSDVVADGGKIVHRASGRAAGYGELDDVTQNHGRSVRRNFNNVVGSIGVRFGEVGDDDFVDPLVWRRHSWPRLARILRFDQFSKYRVSGFEFVLEAKHGQRDCTGLSTRNADDTDAAASGRRRDGRDGVAEFQGRRNKLF